MKIKTILKPIIFALIFIVIFSCLSAVLCRKTIGGAWNYTEKISGFYNSPENEYDVMFFGSSNTYCSFNPLVIYESSGVKSYVLATQLQPVWATYTYMKESLKTQKPQLMVMDVLMFSYTNEYSDEGVTHSYMDDMPFSMNKLELAKASAPNYKEQFGLLLNFVKYHSRWSELTKTDFTFNRSKAEDYLKGYVLLEDTFSDAPYPQINNGKTAELGKKQKEYFYKIVNLAKEENIPLLLVKTPSNVLTKDQVYYNSVQVMAQEAGVPFIDFNSLYEEIGIDMKTDFYDKSHLNYVGAERFSRFFSYTLKEMYPDLSSEDTNNTADMWYKDIEKYREYCENIGK